MLDLDTARTVMLGELDAIIERLERASEEDWERPVRCQGWTVHDLGDHLSGFGHGMAEALRRMREGVAEPAPRVGRARYDRDRILVQLREGRFELAGELAALTPDRMTALVPMPFASLPCFVALQVGVTEAGVHRNDLEWALGNEVPLPGEVTTAISSVAGPLLTMVAQGGEKPDGPLGYVLSGDQSRIALVYRDGAWQQAEDPSVPTCSISGPQWAVMLFVLGRIPHTHPELRLSGEAKLAGRFKAFFPGP